MLESSYSCLILKIEYGAGPGRADSAVEEVMGKRTVGPICPMGHITSKLRLVMLYDIVEEIGTVICTFWWGPMHPTPYKYSKTRHGLSW